ncbi:MAG: glutathione-dependent reductase [Zetaproteobacteria bacterium CG12_big_fil_rev_8_21_14_0_65_54_13]|nr:MAG: glutathione-dependent reductase [Zetaproteobacteria bacterium CG12_big_fil_rev_8_21_14_0_65_54_13]PIX53271.1 MAG: glutathione-dependent reductase [Zetaproteobacteria bacterium CG_4_10_14_3_um_filter_54_28]PJA31011.1 MAG: glutathione-dependent reductase [Zetaproteobacteria bacterium CG_4_9_14_3_um_filter_54_145]
MGVMMDGHWEIDDGRWAAKDGQFHRAESTFHCPFSDGGFTAEKNRYRLYVSLACPWAHRTLIMRKLKGLESIIPVTIVHPHMLENGWQFDTPEPLYGFTHLHQLYSLADPHYCGRVTVPVLWDRQQQTIISNESAEIIRIFNTAFNALTADTSDYYPEPLRAEINTINSYIYDNINNGVYRCGFATTQAAYDEAFDALFAALDRVEAKLAAQRYLVGNCITEADIRLFTTLIRFDAVYVGHFKCNRNRIVDMPNLSNYLRDIYQQPGIAETVSLEHIKQHYYYSHASINPTRIVPNGPAMDFDGAHDRARFSS